MTSARRSRDTVERGEITSLGSISFETGDVNHRGSIRFLVPEFKVAFKEVEA